jgi:hypothetical protein
VLALPLLHRRPAVHVAALAAAPACCPTGRYTRQAVTTVTHASRVRTPPPPLPPSLAGAAGGVRRWADAHRRRRGRGDNLRPAGRRARRARPPGTWAASSASVPASPQNTGKPQPIQSSDAPRRQSPCRHLKTQVNLSQSRSLDSDRVSKVAHELELVGEVAVLQVLHEGNRVGLRQRIDSQSLIVNL